MKPDNSSIKIVFGLVIFMFSIALAYFTAAYVDKNTTFSYWTTLMIFGGLYIALGAIVYRVFPVSLGFLFSSDIIILHVLYENFGDVSKYMKTAIVGVILILLYGMAWYRMNDDPSQAHVSVHADQNPEFPLRSDPPVV